MAFSNTFGGSSEYFVTKLRSQNEDTNIHNSNIFFIIFAKINPQTYSATDYELLSVGQLKQQNNLAKDATEDRIIIPKISENTGMVCCYFR
jgi:hypothetical protein